MDPSRSSVILVFVGLYMGMCVAVGLWALSRTRSTRDFFMAGRDLGIWVTGLAVFSSTMSGFGFVGGPGLVYRMGMTSVWMVMSIPLGYVLCFALLAKRIRLLAELKEPVSLPDAVAARYGSEGCRFLAALAILLGVMGYLATQILAMATVLRDLVAGAGFGVFSMEACVAFSCAVLVFYCVTAASSRRSIRIWCRAWSWWPPPSWSSWPRPTWRPEVGAGSSRPIASDDAGSMSPWGTMGAFQGLSWYLLFILGVAGQPHVVTKMMMNRRIEDAKYILPVSALGYGVSALLWISIGLAMRALVIQGIHPELSGADSAAPQFLAHYVPPVLAGIVFAALFAAIMSTADGFLNIGAAAVVHDIPRRSGEGRWKTSSSGPGQPP